MENKQHIQDFKSYIQTFESVDLGFKVKKLFKVDVEKIRSWFSELERDYYDWKFIIGKNDHVWKEPISDPEGITGHRLMDDTAYYNLCWNGDRPGPLPHIPFQCKEEYRDNDNDELNPRKCFNGYALDLVKKIPYRNKKWLVSIHTPGTKLITHQDNPDKIRIHIPIQTNEQSHWIIDGEEVPMSPGWAYLVNTTLPHSLENKGSTNRIHLYGKVWTEDLL